MKTIEQLAKEEGIPFLMHADKQEVRHFAALEAEQCIDSASGEEFVHGLNTELNEVSAIQVVTATIRKEFPKP